MNKTKPTCRVQSQLTHSDAKTVHHFCGGHSIQKRDLKDNIVLNAAVWDYNCFPFAKSNIC